MNYAFKTTDYCSACGESPESGSGSHLLLHGHEYVPPWYLLRDQLTTCQAEAAAMRAVLLDLGRVVHTEDCKQDPEDDGADDGCTCDIASILSGDAGRELLSELKQLREQNRVTQEQLDAFQGHLALKQTEWLKLNRECVSMQARNAKLEAVAEAARHSPLSHAGWCVSKGSDPARRDACTCGLRDLNRALGALDAGEKGPAKRPIPGIGKTGDPATCRHEWEPHLWERGNEYCPYCATTRARGEDPK